MCHSGLGIGCISRAWLGPMLSLLSIASANWSITCQGTALNAHLPLHALTGLRSSSNALRDTPPKPRPYDRRPIE